MVVVVVVVGVVVDDGSIVDIVQCQVVGVVFVESVEVLGGVEIGYRDQCWQFFLIVKGILCCFVLGIGVGVFDDIEYSDFDEQMMWCIRCFSEFLLFYWLKMVLKNDVNLRFSDILLLIFGEFV